MLSTFLIVPWLVIIDMYLNFVLFNINYLIMIKLVIDKNFFDVNFQGLDDILFTFYNV